MPGVAAMNQSAVVGIPAASRPLGKERTDGSGWLARMFPQPPAHVQREEAGQRAEAEHDDAEHEVGPCDGVKTGGNGEDNADDRYSDDENIQIDAGDRLIELGESGCLRSDPAEGNDHRHHSADQHQKAVFAIDLFQNIRNGGKLIFTQPRRDDGHDKAARRAADAVGEGCEAEAVADADMSDQNAAADQRGELGKYDDVGGKPSSSDRPIFGGNGFPLKIEGDSESDAHDNRSADKHQNCAAC